jgi:hypothetical protein
MTGFSDGPPPPPPAWVPPGSGVQPHRGAVILVLGILGLVYCFPLAIAAWIMGNNDLREIDSGRMDPQGRSMTNVGRILGIISCCWAALSILIAAALLILWAGLSSAMLRGSH